MRSFTVLATFASLAFAAVVSALPASTIAGIEAIPPPPEAAPYLHYRDIDVKVNADVEVAKREPGITSFAVKHLPARNDPAPGIPDLLTQLNEKIVPLCHDLSEKVTGAADANAALQVSLDVLSQVKGLLETTKAEIEGLVANPVQTVFYLNGKLLDAHAIAQIVAVLTVSVSTVLGFVIKACISVQTSELTTLVNDIAGLLAAIIALLVKVIANLLVDLTPLIHCALDIIKDLHLTVLAQALNIKIQA
ncbi:hypothetical protein NP233_g10629 [Leucocoprinus birnbaumii]|uniref:Uncharacterized protein n=1 Tax=Leucocoprinus birnbaumii TaxID=56174 RepID=A0AAD5YRQ6_9AGAR|nr:hypothetical protein NP233_g10629 [Leucocoprinus birnbaumii]